MHRSFQSPVQYLQGPEILGSIGDQLADLDSDRALVLGGETALSTAEDELNMSLETAEIEPATLVRGVSRCSPESVQNCTERGQEADVDLVIGVGGGHALDTAKITSDRLGTPVVIVPTVASTDAPCSSIGAQYAADDGSYLGIVHRARNPELVVVDTAIIARAPPRFLRYGMADALATRFEAEAVASNPAAKTVVGGEQTDAGLLMARQCYHNLQEYGADALAAVERDAVTPAVETIVETNTLLSGMGFECGGLAAAHALQEGFTRAGIDAPHGTVVGVGTIAQLVMENHSGGVLDEALELAAELGLVATLDELGVSEPQIAEIAEHACEDDTPMSNEPVPVTERAAADALRVADELIQEAI